MLRRSKKPIAYAISVISIFHVNILQEESMVVKCAPIVSKKHIFGIFLAKIVGDAPEDEKSRLLML